MRNWKEKAQHKHLLYNSVPEIEFLSKVSKGVD